MSYKIKGQPRNKFYYYTRMPDTQPNALPEGPNLKVGRDHLERHEAKRARKLQLRRNGGKP